MTFCLRPTADQEIVILNENSSSLFYLNGQGKNGVKVCPYNENSHLMFSYSHIGWTLYALRNYSINFECFVNNTRLEVFGIVTLMDNDHLLFRFVADPPSEHNYVFCKTELKVHPCKSGVIISKEAFEQCLNHRKFIKDIESELTCVICTDLFRDPFTLNCSHTFCTPCITKWRNGNNHCPTCRAVIYNGVKVLALSMVASSYRPFSQ